MLNNYRTHVKIEVQTSQRTKKFPYYQFYSNADFTLENINFRIKERMEIGIRYAKKQLKNNNTIFMIRGHQHYIINGGIITNTAPFAFYKQDNTSYYCIGNNDKPGYSKVTIDAEKDLAVLTLISSTSLFGIDHESFAIHDNNFEMTIYRNTLPKNRHDKYLHRTIRKIHKREKEIKKLQEELRKLKTN